MNGEIAGPMRHRRHPPDQRAFTGSHVLAPLLWLLLCASPAVQAATAAAPPPVSFTVTGFTLSDPLPIPEAQADAILAPRIGQELSLDDLLETAKELEAAVRDAGWSFYRIVLPPQTLEAGQVFLQVVNYTVGNIAVEGNRFFSADNIRRSLVRLETGTAANVKTLARDVRYVNRHPVKHVEIRFREGEQAGTVDATLRARDARPWSVFSILRNTGSESTGTNRLSVGYQHTNLFDRDHVLNLTWTTSPHKHYIDDVRQVGISYALPLYALGGNLGAYYAESDVDSGNLENFFEVRGAGEIYGVNFSKYLPRIRDHLDQEVQVSVEDKLFTNDISFANIPIGTNVRSRPLGIRYAVSRETALVKYGSQLQILHNLPGGYANTSTRYRAVRADAPKNWQAIRFAGFGNFSLAGDWRFNFDLTGQYSDDALIPGEQLGLGGLASVRGYEERELAGDSGYVLRSELVAPSYNKARLHWFYDHGYRDLQSPQGGTLEHEWISGTGLGLRYAWKQFALRLDWAMALQDGVSTEEGDFFMHTYLVFKY